MIWTRDKTVETILRHGPFDRDIVESWPEEMRKDYFELIAIDLADLAERLGPLGNVVRNDFLLSFQLPEHRISVFSDGRAIIKGTTDPAKARSLYARYIGS